MGKLDQVEYFIGYELPSVVGAMNDFLANTEYVGEPVIRMVVNRSNEYILYVHYAVEHE